MGRRTERWRAQQDEARALAEAQQAESRRQRTEMGLRMQEQMLGTEEQIAGYDQDPRMLPFTQRVEASQEALTGLMGEGGVWGYDQRMKRDWAKAGIGEFIKSVRGPGTGHPDLFKGGVQEYGNFLADTINTRLGEAEQLAREAVAAGDDQALAEADRLRQEALQLSSKYALGGPGGPERGLFTAAFQTVDDPAAMARQGLSSPLAQIVGTLTKQGREFLDPESATSQQYMQALQRPGQMRLAAERRFQERAGRDVMRGAGAGRNPYLEQALQERAGERVALQSAEMANAAAASFEQFSRGFAAQSAAFAQNWLQGQGGIREQYQGALDNMTQLAGVWSMQSAQNAFQWGQLHAMQPNDFQNIMSGLQSGANLVGTIAGFAGVGA